MRVIQKPVAGGKTYDLMQELMDDPRAVVIVFSQHERDRLIFHYQLPQDTDRVLVFQEGVREKLCGKKYSKVFIDNADYILQMVLGRPVDLITLT